MMPRVVRCCFFQFGNRRIEAIFCGMFWHNTGLKIIREFYAIYEMRISCGGEGGGEMRGVQPGIHDDDCP